MRGYTVEAEDDDWSNLTWLEPFINSVQSVTTIRLECSAALNFTFCSILTDRRSLFSNLTEISVHHVTLDMIKLLLKLDKPFTKLELMDLKTLKKREFLHFEKLLQKRCQTLENLLFIIPRSPLEEEDTPPVFISFPACPKLVNLNVGWGERYHETQDIKLVFSDGTSFVKYGKDLPSLKGLTLHPLVFLKYPFEDCYAKGVLTRKEF